MISRGILEKLVGKRKAGLVVRIRYLLIIDSLSAALAFGISLAIQKESLAAMRALYDTYWLQMLLFLACRIATNAIFELYSRLWRYASVQEVIRIVRSALFSASILFLVSYWILPHLQLPSVQYISFYVLEGMLYFVLLSGSRFTLRVVINWLSVHDKRLLGNLSPRRRTLIVGAGDGGQFMARLMVENPELGVIPIGIIDNEMSDQTTRILNIPVLGRIVDIPRLAEKHHIYEVIVASSNANQNDIDVIDQLCAQSGVPMRVIPPVSALLSGQFSIADIRQWRLTEAVQPDHRPECTYNLTNILITGGAGFIGSNFVRYLLAKYPCYRVIVYDLLTYAGNLDNLTDLTELYGDRYVFIKGDITDSQHISHIMETYQIDAILNFAAETHVDRSLISPDAFIRTNVIGTHCLLEAARTYHVKRYHQVSTDEVYGQVLRGSFFEGDPLETRSPYSASKASADLLVHAYCVSYGVPATITRGSNNIGPYQYPEKVVPLFITNALENKPLPVYGDGLYVRDYQYVLDHCMGIDLVLHSGLVGEIYNVGGGNEVEAIRLAKMILDRLGKPCSLISMVQDRQGQDRRYSLNCSKIRALGWSPQWNFENSLDATISWYIENEWWWRKLKQGEYSNYYELQYRERLNRSGQIAQTAIAD